LVKWNRKRANVEGCNDEEEARVQQEKEEKVMKTKDLLFCPSKKNLVCSQ
jgi:hypothetical protein